MKMLCQSTLTRVTVQHCTVRQRPYSGVEGLGLRTQVLRLADQVVDLFSASQERIHCVVL